MGKLAITCSECGELLALNTDDSRTVIECVQCGTKNPVPPRKARPAALRAGRPEPSPSSEAQKPVSSFTPSPPGSAAPSAPTKPVSLPLSDEEGSTPYQVEAPAVRPCPGCARPLAENAVLCPACGFEVATGGRLRRACEPVHRSWEAGWPLPYRIRLFLIGQAVALPLAVLGALVLEEWTAFVAAWLGFSTLTAFLLGTYARTELTRNERGKVRLTQTWRVCFFARPTETIRRSDYEGVASGKARSADFWDWVTLIALTLAGIVLGVFWWYFAIWRDSFFVALTRDHGFPERTLYWGWDEQQAADMANALQTVAFAPT
jgi:hypothetical protein